MSNITPIHTSLTELRTKPPEITSHEKVTPFTADAVGQTNEANRDAEEALHKTTRGLVEQLNVINDACSASANETLANQRVWEETDSGYVTHRTFVNPIVFFCVSLGIFAGEWIMGAINLRGLGLDDYETYVASFAACGAGFLAAKSIAYTLRCLQHESDPAAKKMAIAMMTANVIFLLMMLVGMSFARASFAEADAQSGHTRFTGTALFGLGALQFALYAMQVATYWAWLPANPFADRARINYTASKKRLQRLLSKRARLAEKLDMRVNRFYARHDSQVAHGKRLIAGYVRGVHLVGKGALLDGYDMTINDGWFLPPSSRVANAVDRSPLVFEQVTQGISYGQQQSGEKS